MTKIEDKRNLSLNAGSEKITLTWENLNVHVPQSTGFFSKFAKKKTANVRNHIVQNANGIAKPGQVLAIMGASGAGKTTLLNVLTFRNIGSLSITGSVKVNGKQIDNPTDLAAMSAYVEQEDNFIGTLKVKEHLTFQAMLRMGKKFTNEEKYARVEEVLNELNLKKCENTLIGVAKLGIKGISGGESRRLSFASEIITNPGLLFCDEPTSGLDSFMAMSIVESMKELASKGKTIICTIHQPSSEIFEQFDRLYLMAEGRLAYTGDLVQAHHFFSSVNYACPTNYNPAEFFIKTLAISPFDKQVCQERVQMICDSFETSPNRSQLNKEIEEAKSEFSSNTDDILDNLKSRIKLNSYKSNSFNQLKWLIWRDFLGTARNPMETKINVLQTIFMAVLFGLIYLRLDYDQKGVMNINGVIFLILTNMTFGNLFPILNSLPKEIPIFVREQKAGMYRVINYYAAKFLNELPKYVILPFMFTTIVYWMCNLNNDPYKFLVCCGTVVLVANATTAFGSLISAASPSVNAAIAISSPLLAPLMIFSGTFLNNKSIPVYFIWIKYISWLGYANEILVLNQWSGYKNITCERPFDCRFKNGEEVIESLKFNEDNYYPNFIYLVALIVGFRLLAFLCLLLKSFRK